MAEVTAATAAPEVDPQLQEALDAGLLEEVHGEDGETQYRMTPLGALTVENQTLKQAIAQAVISHKRGVGYAKVMAFLERILRDDTGEEEPQAEAEREPANRAERREVKRADKRAKRRRARQPAR